MFGIAGPEDGMEGLYETAGVAMPSRFSRVAKLMLPDLAVTLVAGGFAQLLS